MKKINEGFVCIHCKKQVPPADKTCRNHCPYCFTSLHVDGAIPGERKTDCHSIMIPIDYTFVNGDYKILFACTKCEKQHRNKRAIDDEIASLPEKIAFYKSMRNT